MAWFPDTCGCSFNVDNTTAAYISVVNTCGNHPGLSGSALYNQVLLENQNKNNAIGKLMASSPTISSDGQTLNPGVTITPTFSGVNAARSCVLNIHGAVLASVITLQTAVNGAIQPGVPVTVTNT